MRRVLSLCYVIASVAACGAGDLAKDVVTNLPPGNATGSALSGSYDLTVTTRDCSGQCPTFQVAIFTIRICDKGDVDHQTVSATQADGRLTVSGDAGLYVESLVGGISTDGSFDIGGYTNVQGVDVTARVAGTLGADGRLAGQARLLGVGSVEGTSVNCRGTYDVSGARR